MSLEGLRISCFRSAEWPLREYGAGERKLLLVVFEKGLREWALSPK